jgi:hypothetical protein
MASELPEKIDPVEAVDTHRESGGHAPIAGVGDMVGDGLSRCNDGRSGVSCVVAMLACAHFLWQIMQYLRLS